MQRVLRSFFWRLTSNVTRLRLILSGVKVGRSVTIHGRFFLDRAPGSLIQIADRVTINTLNSRNTLEARGPIIVHTLLPSARLAIGPDTGITSATLSCASSITIGARVLIGSGVLITDSNHHRITHSSEHPRRHAGFPSPSSADAIVIEDDVFIGARAMIFKGVRIGRGSVVGAGSVVRSDIGENQIVAGNPAVMVGLVKGE